LEYLDTSNVVFTSGAAFGILNAGAGELSFSWNDNTPLDLPNGEILFTINFNLNSQAGLTIPVFFQTNSEVFISQSSFPFSMSSSDYTLSSGSFFVFDDTAPSLTCPMDVNVASTDGTDVIVPMIPPTASDNCGIMDTSYVLTDVTTSTILNSGNGDVSGMAFPVGTTNVEYTVTDFDGNATSCDFDVTVSPPGIVTIEIDSIQVNCSDNAVLLPIRVKNFADVRGFQFSINWDESILTYAGIIQDNLAPNAIPGTTNVTMGELGMSWFGLPTTFNNGDTILLLAFNILDNSIGNPIEFTYANSLSFQITTVSSFPQALPANQTIAEPGLVEFIDTEDPSFTDCPMNITVEAMGMNSVQVSDINAVATDNCSNPEITYVIGTTPPVSGIGDASGFSFPAGEITTVIYTATDEAGNTDVCSFTVTVNEDQDPLMIECPTNINLENDPGVCTADTTALPITILSDVANINQVGYTMTTPTQMISDSGQVAAMTYEVGLTTITYFVEDNFGETESCTFTVTVTDNEAPVFSNVPNDNTINCDDPVPTDEPTANDNCDGMISVVLEDQTVTPGTALGSVIIKRIWSATDANNNTVLDSAIIIIQDITPPSITCPADITVEAGQIDMGECGAIVTWNDPVTDDNCDMDVQTTSGYDPGDFFAIGTTEVTYFAVDDAGNVDSCKFNVTVEDTQAPVLINCPNDTTIIATNGCSAPYTWMDPDVMDNCNQNLTISSSVQNGSEFSGMNTVTITAADESGNTSTCSFIVTVIDTIPPFISCPADVELFTNGTIMDPNQTPFISNATSISCDSVTIEFETPVAFDLITPQAACVGEIAFLTSNEITGAMCEWVGPDGTIYNDCSVTLNDLTVADSGQYNLTVFDPVSGCTIEDSVSLSVIQGAEIGFTVNPILCTEGTENAALNATHDGSVIIDSWVWTNPDGDTISTDQFTTVEMVTIDDAGIYCVTATSSEGCETTTCDTLIVTQAIMDEPTITSNCDGFVCVGNSCELAAVFSGNNIDSVVWSVTGSTTPGAEGLPADPNQAQITITPTQNGIYTYTVTVYSEGCPSSSSTAVNVSSQASVAEDFMEVQFNGSINDYDVTENDVIPGSLPGTFTINVTSDVNNGTLTNNGDGTFDYTPDEGFFGTDQFIYEICVQCQIEVCVWAIVNIEVTTDECLVPTVITPNEDGMNDELRITCVEDHPTNELVIYSRWGDEVYRASPYNNDWKGTYNNQELPDGTYYYVFRIDVNDPDPKKGAITIMR